MRQQRQLQPPKMIPRIVLALLSQSVNQKVIRIRLSISKIKKNLNIKQEMKIENVIVKSMPQALLGPDYMEIFILV